MQNMQHSRAQTWRWGMWGKGWRRNHSGISWIWTSTFKPLSHTYGAFGEHQVSSYYKSSSICLSVCLFVPLLLRGPLMDLRQTWWVYVGGPWNCPWGVLFWKGQRVNGSNITFSEQTTPGWDHTAAKGTQCLLLSTASFAQQKTHGV